MASIANDPGGRKRALFTCPDGERRAIWVGKISQRAADAIKVKFDDLESAVLSGCGWKPETALWVAEIPDSLAHKLAAKGSTADPSGYRRNAANRCDWRWNTP